MLDPSEVLSLFVRLWDGVFATQINAQLSQNIFHYLKMRLKIKIGLPKVGHT